MASLEEYLLRNTYGRGYGAPEESRSPFKVPDEGLPGLITSGVRRFGDLLPYIQGGAAIAGYGSFPEPPEPATAPETQTPPALQDAINRQTMESLLMRDRLTEQADREASADLPRVAPPFREAPAPTAPQEESLADLKARFGYRDERFSTGPREIGRGFGQTWEKPLAGGTVSTGVTAPENVAEMTQASRADELDRKIRENYMRQLAADPFFEQRQRQQAKVNEALAIEEGKVLLAADREAANLDRLRGADAEIDADAEKAIATLKNAPGFARYTPQQQEEKIAAIMKEAEGFKQAHRADLGLATGRVSTSYRGGGSDLPPVAP